MPTTLNGPRDPEDSGFRLTGRRVLMILVATFGVVFLVNGYMIWHAVGSFPGLVTESSFRDSQKFNSEIAAAQAQAARGWKVAATAERADDGSVAIRVEARDAADRPLSGISFTARLEHPAVRSSDHKVDLKPVPGTADVHAAIVQGVSPGKWGLVIEGHGAEGRMFLSQNTLYFK